MFSYTPLALAVGARLIVGCSKANGSDKHTSLSDRREYHWIFDKLTVADSTSTFLVRRASTAGNAGEKSGS